MMKKRVLIELEIETSIDEHPEDYVEQILDWGNLQELIEDRDEELGVVKVTSAMVSKLEDDLKQILWPDGDAEHEWSPDTIDAVARRLQYLRPLDEELPAVNVKVASIGPNEDVDDAIDKIMRAERQAEILRRKPDVTPEMLARTAHLANAVGEALGMDDRVEPVSGMDHRAYTVVGLYHMGVGAWESFVEHFDAANPAHAVSLLEQQHRDLGIAETRVAEVFEGHIYGKLSL